MVIAAGETVQSDRSGGDAELRRDRKDVRGLRAVEREGVAALRRHVARPEVATFGREKTREPVSGTEGIGAEARILSCAGSRAAARGRHRVAELRGPGAAEQDQACWKRPPDARLILWLRGLVHVGPSDQQQRGGRPAQIEHDRVDLAYPEEPADLPPVASGLG